MMKKTDESACFRFMLPVLMLLLLPALTWAQDPLISEIALKVERNKVESIIQTLEDFGTRYSFTSRCDAAADRLFREMEGYGIEVYFEEFDHGGKTMKNIIGRIEGSVYPDRIFIVGAHYDATSNDPWNDAPGADDNASGVAAVLEAARIMSGYQFENTVEFICFGGEEQGRQGSQANAADAVSRAKDIRGMINLDMIGYWPANSDMEMDIGKNVQSAWLADLTEQAALTYASIPVRNWPDTGVCHDDHVSYWDGGYSAVVLMNCYEAHRGLDGESTPHYHRTTDTIATLDLDQTTEAVRTTVAAMAILAVPVVPPITLYGLHGTQPEDVLLSWSGGAPNFDAEACQIKSFDVGIMTLTPAGGIQDSVWTHGGVMFDGLPYYYKVKRH
ncbi:M28 family metallopeptidase [Acidobacteriota bacterium]